MKAQDISGEYYLAGVREMASGFLLRPDRSFEFFLSYGAMDRIATGTYTVEGNTVLLHSTKRPGSDFTVARETRRGKKGYTIRILDENPVLAGSVRCTYTVSGMEQEAFADDNGVISIDVPSCDEIAVQHGIFVDAPTIIKTRDNTNNYFELTLNPEMQEVSFTGIEFTVSGDTLACPANYLFPVGQVRYVKSR